MFLAEVYESEGSIKISSKNYIKIKFWEEK